MVSIFTPTHDTRFLAEAHRSLRAQTDPNWEWTILLNGDARKQPFADDRISWVEGRDLPPHVGALKARACNVSRGEILLELDHDDMLAPGAVAAVRDAFASTDAGFVYSNAMRVNADWTRPERWSDAYGWKYRTASFNGHKLDEAVSFDASPASVSRIWFAPDHLRAFRRKVYEQAGGYNADMRVLDDQDFMSRMYPLTTFHHIDRPLYVYRIHGENAWLKHNAEIQDNTWRLYDQYIESLALTWAKREGLRSLDLGAAIAAAPAYESVDLHDADVTCDLNSRWPFADSSVGVIRAFDVFEHLKDPLHTMREVSRVLAPGGWLFCQVPSTDGRGAFQDPTHVSFWNENSFHYYTKSVKAKYIGTPVRFQATRLYTTEKNHEGVCWTVAHLVNLKDDYRPPGVIEI